MVGISIFKGKLLRASVIVVALSVGTYVVNLSPGTSATTDAATNVSSYTPPKSMETPQPRSLETSQRLRTTYRPSTNSNTGAEAYSVETLTIERDERPSIGDAQVTINSDMGTRSANKAHSNGLNRAADLHNIRLSRELHRQFAIPNFSRQSSTKGSVDFDSVGKFIESRYQRYIGENLSNNQLLRLSKRLRTPGETSEAFRQHLAHASGTQWTGNLDQLKSAPDKRHQQVSESPSHVSAIKKYRKYLSKDVAHALARISNSQIQKQLFNN